jgi:type IV secretion system protein TrbI
MNIDGLPPLNAGPSASPDSKLSPDQGGLRASRSKPARYNGRIAALAAGGAAVLVVGAIFVPAILGKGGHAKTPAQTSANSAPAVPPVEAISYDAGPADPSTGTGGVDCSQYPGMPGCAGANAAAATMPASPTGGQAPVQAAAGNPPASGAQPASAPAPSPLGLPGASPASAARSSGVFFGGSVGNAVEAIAASVGAPAAAAQPPTPLPSPVTVLPPQKEAAQPAEVMVQNGQGEKAAFAKAGVSQDYVEAKLQKPRSPYEIKAGTVIPAALMTAINSDLPGEVIAQVTQPVYDHVTGKYVLIPQGSRIIGRYDSQVAYGQTRALVVWRRVIFPNGNSLNFGAMGAADPTGAAGLADRVDDHFGQLAKGIVLSTLLSMGVSSAQDAQARSSGTLVLNSGASGLANEAESVGSRLTNRDLNRQPTIEIRQGAEVRVLVDKDMILAPYS